MFNKRDYKYFNLAESVAELSDFPRIHIGSVLVIKNEIISVGCNVCKSHPEQKRCNRYRNYQDERCYIHSEAQAIIRAKDTDLSRSRLYIFRKDLNGHLAPCRPCPACQQKIKENNIRHIYYTTRDGFAYEEILI